MRNLYPLLATMVAIVIIAAAVYLVHVARIRNAESKQQHSYTIASLNKISQTKYEHSQISAHYADIAEQEAQHGTATLLKAISKAETIQHDNCNRAIHILGGKYHITPAPAISITTTKHHLHLIIENKFRLHKNIVQNLIRHTASQNNIYVARILTWCDASDIGQIMLLRRELSHLSSITTSEHRRYMVCPKCSNICDDEFVSHLCPHCMTPFSEFLVFE